MQSLNLIRNILVLALVIGACTSCDNDFMQVEAPNNKGVLCLQMSSNQHYIDIETRASQALADWTGYTFMVGNEAVTFVDGKTILEAGTYTLSATNANAQGVDAGYGAPLYDGSVNFTISAGQQTDVTLDLGKPANAKLTLSVSEAFAAKYDLQSFTLNDGTRSATLTTANNTAYFPVNSISSLSYTINAPAKAGSHVQEIIATTGTISITAGYHTEITLNLNPIDDSLIIIESGNDHGGEFQ